MRWSCAASTGAPTSFRSSRPPPIRPIASIRARRARDARLPRVLSRPEGHDHRRSRVHRQQPGAPSRRARGRRAHRRLAHRRLRRQPVQCRRHRRSVAREHRRRAPADDDELPGPRPRGDLQPRRPGEPHRQHARSVHRPRNQLSQSADGPRGVSQSQSGREGRFCRHPAGVRTPGIAAGRRGAPRPTDVNGINKAAGEYYHLVYNNVFGVRACSLRLTNVYGPRQLIKHDRQGFIGWFIRLAIENQPIQIYGDGSQLRDFVYVDDAADAFLRAGANDACNGEVFNIGGDQPISHRDLTALLVDVAGSGRVEYVDWPPEKKRIDIGSFYADSTKFKRTTAWAPSVALRDGLRRTLAFYRQHYDHYVPAPRGQTAERV